MESTNETTQNSSSDLAETSSAEAKALTPKQKKNLKKKEKEKAKKKQDDQSLGSLNKWLVDNSASMKNLAVANFTNTGRGLITREDIQSGDVVVKIPKNLLLTAEAATTIDVLKDAIKEAPNVTNDDILALLILFEKQKGEQSFWYSYISLFPNTHTNVLYFNEQDIQQLQGSNLQTITVKLQAQVKQDYENLFTNYLFKKHSAAFDSNFYNLERYKWALSVIWSRAVDVKIEDKLVRVMVPFVDFMNHQVNVNMSHKFDTQQNAFVVTANQACKKENQIFLNYGALPNVRLLHLMGFTIPENPFDCFEIWAPMSPEDPLAAYKEQLLESHNINVNKSFALTLNGANIPELLTVLRIQRMEPTEFASGENAFASKSISKRNDQAAVSALEGACRSLLQGYATTLQEDEATLAGSGTQNNNNGTNTPLSVNMRNILNLRIGEKKVLQATLDNIAVLKKKLGL